MQKQRSRRHVVVTAVVLSAAAAACLLILLPLSVCRDWAFICQNTGSRKGYREWFFGAQTGHWYRQSELELFMATRHPTLLRHKWTSYAGTGKNILGIPVLHGHGRPGPIVLLSPDLLDEHVHHLDEATKKALYDAFASADQDRIQKEVDRILVDFPRKR